MTYRSFRRALMALVTTGLVACCAFCNMGGIVNNPFVLTARAEDAVYYVNRTYDETTNHVISETLSVSEYTVVTDGTTRMENGYYVVNSDVTVNSRIQAVGAVHLILCDGARLYAKKGITAYGTLWIYGQSGDTGRLETSADAEQPGLGGYNPLITNGLLQQGYENSYIHGTVIINGGTIYSVGGVAAAGIGDPSSNIEGTTIVINGGDVTARAGDNAAGIGGGANITGVGHQGNAGTISIHGGSVKAYGSRQGAGIGGGGSNKSNVDGGDGGTIIITGGTVKARGDSGTYSGGTRYNNYGIGPGCGSAIAQFHDGNAAMISLSWDKLTDSVYADSYGGDMIFARDFVYMSGETEVLATTAGASTLKGKTLLPYVAEGCAKISGANLTLGGDIGLNYYVILPDALAENGAQAVLNGPVGEKRIAFSTLTKTNGQYKISYGLKAFHMNRDCTIKIVDAQNNTIRFFKNASGEEIENGILHYSIEQYYHDIYATLNATDQAWLNAIRTYGAHAARWKYSDALLEGINTLPNLTYESDEISRFRVKLVGEKPDTVTLTGATLLLEEATSFRLYFQVTDSINNHVVELDGNAVTPKVKNGAYYVEVSNLGANKLTTEHVVDIDGYQVTFCAMTYVYNVLKNFPDNEILTNLVKAFYLYGVASGSE